MKKLFHLALVSIFILSACGGVKTTVGNDDYSKRSQVIAKKWITAFQERDLNAILQLYSNDLIWRDCSIAPCDKEGLGVIKVGYASSFKDPNFEINVESYLVTTYGQFVILQGTFRSVSENVPKPTPVSVILEIKNGMIVNETWYYLSQ